MTVATSTNPTLSDANVSDELEALLRSPVDERAARATLRQQIARLERDLAALTFDLWQAGRSRLPSAPSDPAQPTGARLLGVGELEAVRDALIDRIDSGRRVLEQRAETQSAARAHLQEMLADPATHRF